MHIYTLRDYEKSFEDYQKCLGLAKKVINDRKVRLIKPSEAIRNYRESLLRLFSLPELYQVCHKCKGKCCSTHNFSLKPIELLYFVGAEPSFEFPEPDWQFLTRKRNWSSDDPCLFLTDEGCLLKEYRSEACLTWYDCDYQFYKLRRRVAELCSPAEREKIFLTQKSHYHKVVETFCHDLLKAAGIPEESKSYLEILNILLHKTVGFKSCLEALEKLAKEKKSP